MHILLNAEIYTQNPDQPLVTALAITQGRILVAGSSEEVLQACGASPDSRIVEDLNGQTILPGIVDAHLHLEHYSLGLLKIDCETPTRSECLELVRSSTQNTPEGDWILGHGWNQNVWEEGFGDPADLDSAAPAHPVYLTAKSLHAGWANRTALQRAGITSSTPDPRGGHLDRNAQGMPTGLLFESAMQLVESALPEPTTGQVAQAIKKAQTGLWRMGITGVHDFDRSRCFQALQILHSRFELGLRVLKSLALEDLPHAAALGLRTGFGDDWLRIGGIKAFADGALGPQTAAMLAPYEGQPENRGMLFLDAEELFELGRKAAASGLSLAVHAIGDRANHEVLDAFSQLRSYEREMGLPALRHRIEHVQVLHPDDATRLAALHVIASMQPIHGPSDMHMADRYWGSRANLSYAWRTQLAAGAHLAFGSDAPVESPNPFLGLYAAVTRKHPDTPQATGWRMDQALSFAEALSGFTTGAAYAAGMENRLGKLAPGFLADLVLLDRDPFTLPPDEIKDIQPAGTMVGGKWVYRQ